MSHATPLNHAVSREEVALKASSALTGLSPVSHLSLEPRHKLDYGKPTERIVSFATQAERLAAARSEFAAVDPDPGDSVGDYCPRCGDPIDVAPDGSCPECPTCGWRSK